MSLSFAFHAGAGRADFLGLRERARGAVEIVYDDGVAKRLVWKVQGKGPDPSILRDALSSAVREARVVPALYAELRRRAIDIELIAG
ncbi:MAG: hypothetical protein ACO3BE_10825 [Gemmobacter sp.]